MKTNIGAMLREIAQGLVAAGYGAGSLQQLLRIVHPDDIGPLNHAATLERLHGDTSLLTLLTRLLFLEDDVPLARLRRYLSPATLRKWSRAGLLRVRGASAVSRMRMDFAGALLVLSDRRFRRPDPRALDLPPGDMVYPPGGDSLLLAEVVEPRGSGRALDLCTGSGVQGLLVAPRVEEVVAVDIGARAAALAKLNAALNGIENFRVGIGDLYAPVRGERFDLIVANPPFVPGPRRGPAYHSGGPRGDRVLRRVLEGFSTHIAPEGRGFVVSYLALRNGESVADVIAPWLASFDGRVIVVVAEIGTRIDLAAAQALFALDRGLASYAREVRRWASFLRGHRIAQVALLLIAAEQRGRVSLDVHLVPRRILPIPLSPPPAQVIRSWLAE